MSDDIPVKDSEMDELKREMRSAQWAEWAQKNQKMLIGVASGVLIVLMMAGLWIENDRSKRATAATLYQQAVNETDLSNKKALLQNMSRDFSSSSYGALALMQLAVVDKDNAVVHLESLIQHEKAMEEWIWQAKIDLAVINIAAGDTAAAKAALDQQVGKQYQQVRYYLLSQVAADEKERQEYLQKALDAPFSNDQQLIEKIESQLSKNLS